MDEQRLLLVIDGLIIGSPEKRGEGEGVEGGGRGREGEGEREEGGLLKIDRKRGNYIHRPITDNDRDRLQHRESHTCSSQQRRQRSQCGP